MTRLLPDPELDRLVRELNEERQTAAANASRSPWPAAQVPSGNPLETLLIDVARRGASDLLIIAGAPTIFRVGGRLVRGESAPLSGDEVAALLDTYMTPRIRERIAEDGAVDFSLRLAPQAEAGERTWRFRVNIHRQRGTLAAAIRALPTNVPTIAGLGLPPVLGELVKPTRGLVLVCGPTGAGKTTTLAAMIGAINRDDARHVITIEDPIEYEHRNVQSVIEQVEVGRDAPSFASALRAALRQDPDVILVGEMRDLETVATALTAAETGHLILSTLHTGDVAHAIHRIVDVFPSAQQTQIRQQLALSLNAIVVQQLVPSSASDGRAVAVEVLLANAAVRNHIRRDKMENLITEITLGKRQGMISIEDSLARLVRQGVITVEDARIRSTRPEELESQLRS
ncbi:MAG TPA: PilT/PilU family type 4a pilus ATPase [Thermoanaerobaculia bacterium]|jgi:twitching motility protein PilT|nr:PilT/PilU family type 4a pilus ATPase [Thermoanaerobaculia bacterium]